MLKKRLSNTSTFKNTDYKITVKNSKSLQKNLKRHEKTITICCISHRIILR